MGLVSEERIVSKQSINTFLKEIEHALTDSEAAYGRTLSDLKNLDPFLNLKIKTNLHSEAGRASLAQFKQGLKDFQIAVERMTAAYNDLSTDLQSALVGRAGQDVLLQELARQGALLAQEINRRQEAGRVLKEMASVLDRINVQEKATPAQQKKIEDLVFRLQVLG